MDIYSQHTNIAHGDEVLPRVSIKCITIDNLELLYHNLMRV